MKGDDCEGRGTDRAIRVGEMEQRGRREGGGEGGEMRGMNVMNGCSENEEMAPPLSAEECGKCVFLSWRTASCSIASKIEVKHVFIIHLNQGPSTGGARTPGGPGQSCQWSPTWI